MKDALHRKAAIWYTLAAIALAIVAFMSPSPASAQFSDGYNFLKAVKERDGNAVTDALNEPGTTIANTRDISSGETALHIVVARRDGVWINFLLSKGANPNIADKKDVTPLMLASRLGYVEGVEKLAKAGARVDVADNTGETPLIAAVHSRDTPMIAALLEAGADPDRTDNSGRSARDYAELQGSSSAPLREIQAADEDGKSKKKAPTYGPSF